MSPARTAKRARRRTTPRWSGTDEHSLRTGVLPLLSDIGQGLWSLVTVLLALLAGLAVAGLSVVNWALFVGLTAGAILLLEVGLAAPLRALAARGSVITALLLGVTAQLLVLGAALTYGTSFATLDAGTVAVVLLVAAALLALGRWIVGASDSAYIVGSAARNTNRARAFRRRAADRDSHELKRGLLVVQLDGVSLPTLRRAIEGGQAPNLARWAATTHTLDGWWATAPSTTPASMAGFLHGDDETVPAFRWWDRREGRLLASSSTADSLLVENRITSHAGARPGLLAHNGTAISTTYSGGARYSYLTISQATRARGLGPGSAYVTFFARPLLLPGALALTVGEIVKELYQARRQRVRGVEPRIRRRGAYVALRGLTNVLLRKLNLSLVAQEMASGRSVIFVDFVDYDEIAHHAGPERPESLRAIEGLDGVLASLQEVAHVSATEYELVVLSDHGQSLGATFEQLTGQTLTDRVQALTRGVEGAQSSGPAQRQQLGTAQRQQVGTGEDWGPFNALVASVLGRWAKDPSRIVLGPDRAAGRATDDETPQVVVTGGGNLGMVWFPGFAERPTLGAIAAAWPDLVPGLLATAGVGLVLATDQDGAPVVLSADGARRLTPDSEVTGKDPLLGYPSRTADDLRRLAGVRDSGDLVLISTVDEDGRIHAFEHQVGSHGGLGGPQNHAILLHPRDWAIDTSLTTDVPEVGPDPVLVGPVAVHDQLVAWRDRWLGAVDPGDGRRGRE